MLSSSTPSTPSEPVSSLPDGSLATRTMILERSSSVILGLRPAPGRSPSPSIPSALKRWRRFLTVLGWQPSSSAILAVRSPCQLRKTMRARKVQSAGAWRLPANLRIFDTSAGSSGTLARRSFGIAFSFPVGGLVKSLCLPPLRNGALEAPSIGE